LPHTFTQSAWDGSGFTCTTVGQVQEATGFELLLPDGEVPETTPPTAEQVRLLREVIDPDGMCKREAGVKS